MENQEAPKQPGDVIWNTANLLRGPYRPNAWIDHQKTKVGDEIPFNRHVYEHKPPRPLATIEHDIAVLERDIVALLKDVTA
ncbi:hypothetical protein [Hydrogenophaga sp.]|uniref:hypothetical protein n=1 Tax=Hydrogenophaga sp. TaxID=1904254 RepID=UPI00286D8DB4|nr:hypothetical protein [Hydrogenophaga sp.]